MDIITFRRHIHSHPELSFQEEQTALFIESALSEAGISHSRIASTGVLAKLEGRGDLKRAVVLRADIDALPIEEQTGVEFSSKNEGVMHACGHDMHAAMLFGALLQLKECSFEGTIFGLFQPGEECNPGGSTLVMAEKPFEGYDVLSVVGQHVEAQLEVGTVGFRAGKYMASSDELRFEIQGVGGHAAMRGRLTDPIAATAEFITGLLAFNREELVLSIGKIVADGATNVIPHRVNLEGTLRTFDEGERLAIKESIKVLAQEVGRKHNLTIVVDINKGFPSVVNDERLTAQAVALANESLNVEMLPLRTTSEDFGFYGAFYPSLFYRVGVGAEAGAPHTSKFCPNEGALTVGAELMSSLALRFLDYEKEK